MRLGVLLDRVVAPVGGAERHTLALLARAAATEGGAALATLVGGLDASLLPPGVEAIGIDAPRPRPERDQAFARRGPAALREAGCDVVLAVRHALDCDVYFPHGGLVQDARDAKDRATGGASLWTRMARTFSRKHEFFLEAERRQLGAADGPLVISVSNVLAERMKAVFPACRERLVTVLNGVDAEHFRRAPFSEAGAGLRARHVPDGARVALLLAKNLRLKGIEAAIGALARPVLRDVERPVHLLVVGDRLGSAMRRHARDLGVADRVHELGALDDPRPAYAAADVLVHPTWYDPCSLVCLEAMSMELPVITTPGNGVRDLMGHKAGIVVEEPGNAEAIAWALKVFDDERLRRLTAEDARYLAESNRESTRLDHVLDLCRGRVRVG
jgi:UDP-glucose:(heptosyl)LPS alpha-1,3-glucosyltransferase